MKILLVNDDGIYADGIRAMAKELSGKHDLVLVAPESERSGASHSITLTMPLRIREVKLDGLKTAACYSVNGTPADCVIFGVNALNVKPDLIISGINHGFNLGTDVHYSGTVSAATEGALLGTPSMAVSLRCINSNDFSTAARVAAELIDDFIESGSMLFNINVPDLPYDEIKGIKYTRLSQRVYSSPFEKRTDPRNRDYYWWPSRLDYDGDRGADNDERWSEDGYVTVTPLLLNNSDEDLIKKYTKED